MNSFERVRHSLRDTLADFSQSTELKGKEPKRNGKGAWDTNEERLAYIYQKQLVLCFPTTASLRNEKPTFGSVSQVRSFKVSTLTLPTDSMKRSRSSTSGNALLLSSKEADLRWDRCDGHSTHTQPVVLTAPRGVLEISSPEVLEEGEGDRIRIGDQFLQKCFSCKKTLLQSSDVYMYGYFGAFCTPECRLRQVALDMVMEKFQEQSKGRRTSTESECSTRKDKICGSQPGKSEFHI